MRVPVFLGSKQEVESATRYHREHDAVSGNAAVVA
jgi:fructose-1,6-bisphosphatase I